MLNQEISKFCTEWLNKSHEIDDTKLSGLFDKFFTLYVVYNRLYVETTFRMANNGQINLNNRNTFPDDKAAKVYVIQYLTGNKINEEFQADQECVTAIESLKIIIQENKLNIKLHQITGIPDRGKDLELLEKLESNKIDTKIRGITEYIYSIRCNIFHAQKGYHNQQKIVLRPINILLEKLIKILFEKLKNN